MVVELVGQVIHMSEMTKLGVKVYYVICFQVGYTYFRERFLNAKD